MLCLSLNIVENQLLSFVSEKKLVSMGIQLEVVHFAVVNNVSQLMFGVEIFHANGLSIEQESNCLDCVFVLLGVVESG